MKVIISEVLGDEYPIISNRFGKVNSYKDYSKLIGCDYFDVVMTEFKGEKLSIFVDDEGLMKAGNFGRMIHGIDSPIFGNYVITGGVDDEGETLPIPKTISLLDLEELVSEVKYQLRG